MSAEQVIYVLDLLQESGVAVWVDGGWGIDALVGEQTREHDDLDVVVPADAVSICRQLLTEQGFAVERDWLPTALALRHPDGRAVDLHPVEPSTDGGGDQIQLDGVRRWRYEPPVVGAIAGRTVLCCSVECQLAAHIGYEPDANDRADMELLAQRFGVSLPALYLS